jgi:hypothetical protein
MSASPRRRPPRVEAAWKRNRSSAQQLCAAHRSPSGPERWAAVDRSRCSRLAGRRSPVRAGHRRSSGLVGRERSAVCQRDPPSPFETADAHWTFTWRDPRIEWYEEATEVQVHARDPRHRVDAIPSERHVRVELDGELLAESRRPLALFESGLPTRWYLPAEDVRQELLEPSDTTTRCPYKGRPASSRCGSPTNLTASSPGVTPTRSRRTR